jgi:hypothetical protein
MVSIALSFVEHGDPRSHQLAFANQNFPFPAKVSSVVMGGNLWVESEQASSDEASSKEVSASMELSLSYLTSSGKMPIPL